MSTCTLTGAPFEAWCRQVFKAHRTLYFDLTKSSGAGNAGCSYSSDLEVMAGEFP